MSIPIRRTRSLWMMGNEDPDLFERGVHRCRICGLEIRARAAGAKVAHARTHITSHGAPMAHRIRSRYYTVTEDLPIGLGSFFNVSYTHSLKRHAARPDVAIVVTWGKRDTQSRGTDGTKEKAGTPGRRKVSPQARAPHGRTKASRRRT